MLTIKQQQQLFVHQLGHELVGFIPTVFLFSLVMAVLFKALTMTLIISGILSLNAALLTMPVTALGLPVIPLVTVAIAVVPPLSFLSLAAGLHLAGCCCLSSQPAKSSLRSPIRAAASAPEGQGFNQPTLKQPPGLDNKGSSPVIHSKVYRTNTLWPDHNETGQTMASGRYSKTP